MIRNNQAGMSVVEILIATFILFFVVTAIMGLLSMTFIMSAGARYQTTATAFLNRQIEQMRAMAYTDVGTQGGDPNGTLLAEEETTYAGITYTINRDIQWKDDVADNDPQTESGADSDRHDYKEVTVTLTWRNPTGGAEQHLSISTSIREPWVDTNAPTVDFTANNVPANSIVYGESIEGGGSLYVQASADDNLDAAGAISSLIFYVDGRVLRNPGYTPTTASWAPNTQTFTNTAYPWNTLSVDESAVPLYADGIRELKVEAWDNSGARDFKIINVTVDNYAPGAPSGLSATTTTANSTCFSTINLAWTGAMDGTDWADQYRIERAKNGSADATTNVAGSLTSSTDSSLTSFANYSYRMLAVSPRLLASSYTGWTDTRMTLPKLTATVGGSGNNRTAIMTWTAPSFEITSAQYKIHQATTWTSGNITSAAIATVNHPTVTYTSTTFNKSITYYWQVEVSYVIGGTTYTAWSNVIGPSPTAIGSTYPIPP